MQNIIVTAAAEGRHMDFDFALQFGAYRPIPASSPGLYLSHFISVLGENVQSADVAVQVGNMINADEQH